MSAELKNFPEPPQQPDHPCADRWRLIRRACIRCNKLSHHIVGFCLKLVILFCLLFCILCLVLRYVLLPHIDQYKGDIEQLIGASVGRTVHIAQISASWRGLRPNLQLQQVTIADDQGKNALMLPDLNLTVSWLAAFLGQVRFYNLEINSPELELKRSADGKIYIAGWWVDPARKGDARGLNWILSQRQISIKNGLVHWTDAQRGAPVLTLSGVNFIMQNKWRQHTFSFMANPPAGLAGPLDVRAHFSHRVFSDNISDYKQWKGQIYGDFRQADLAAWKSYVDYPFDVQAGVGSVRVWTTFDQTRMLDFTADMRLTNVKARLRKDLQALDLLSMSGRISAQEMIRSNVVEVANASVMDRLRENGHQISLTGFTFESRDGLRLPPTNLTEQYIPANQTTVQQLQFSTQFLDLKVLANLIQHFPMQAEYAAMLKNFEPAGQLSDITVRLQGDYPKLQRYQIKGRFSNLTMKPQLSEEAQKDTVAIPAIPGFKNLSGAIDANEKQGVVQIASTDLALQLPDYFSEPEMQFDRFDMQASWDIKNNQLMLNLARLDLTRQDMRAHFSGTHKIPISTEKKQPLGLLDLTGSIQRLDLQKIARFVPSLMQKNLQPDLQSDLHHWLANGLQQGYVDDVAVRIKGDLADFPFVRKGLLDQNIFHVTGKIVNGKIDYLPGTLAKDNVSPYWPVLSKINGKIIFERASLEIDADSAETAGVAVSRIKARIPDLLSDDVALEIVGEASGAGQDMLDYLRISPVLDWIGNFTQDTKMSGNAKLQLKLDLPLMHINDAKVTGVVQLAGNDVVLIRDLPLLSQVSGRIEFNEHGLNLNKLKAGFLGGPTSVTGGTQKDGVIRIKAEGQLNVDGVRKAYPQPELRHLLTRVDGMTPYTAIIQIRGRQTDVWVDSSLQGMVLRLPVPLKKAATDNLPLHFELTGVANSAGAAAGAVSGEQDELKLSLGKILNVRYVRHRSDTASPWKVISGGIGVNVPAPMPDSGLSAYLELTSLNIEDLQTLLPDKNGAPPARDANKNTESGYAGFDLHPYLEPDEIAARATELTLMGKKIDRVIFGASRDKGVWQANIDSRQITGYLTWSNADHGLGNVTARLSSLIIPDSTASDVVDLLQNRNLYSSIPGLNVMADSVELFGKKLGRLELQAKNVNTPNTAGGNEWQIEKLNLVNPDAELTAQGKWVNGTVNGDNRFGPVKSQTTMKYQLNLINAGKLLDRFGYAKVFTGGKGKLTGEVSWTGSPYSLNVPTLAGKVRLDLQSGQFLKVEPGAAKLLAVLNLQALPRRLMLDFRDVFSEGFAFDGITGDARIEQGVISTDNLKMRSVSATVLLSGRADIAGETQNLHVVVIPEVNAGAASVLYGLAVNPVIGLGTFLAQLFLREPLMKAFTFEYQITGPWKEPNVVKL